MAVDKQRVYLTKPEIARHSNDRIAEKAVQYRFVSRIPMLCECGDPDCERIVLIGLDAYRQLRSEPSASLTAPGHAVQAAPR